MTAPADKHASLKALSYRLFGKVSSRFMLLKPAYAKSGLPMWYESYIALMLFSSAVTFITAFITSALLHYFLFELSITQLISATLMLSIVASIIVSVIFVIYPINRGNQRKTEIDSNLVYTAGYMSVLAAGGVSVERIFDRVVQVERHTAIRELAKKSCQM